MKFKLSKEFVERYQDVVEYVVIARGVNNEISGKWIVDEMKTATASVRKVGTTILEQPKYKKWIDIFAQMAKNASLKTRDFDASHVALIKRVLSGKDMPNINPLVNFYNLYSLRYGVPIGGENLAAVYGDTELAISKGGDLYLGIGEKKVIKTSLGETMWKDAHSITCRMWNWRQSERTKLTKSASDIYFVFDGFRKSEDVDLKSITQKFARELEEKFGASVVIGVIDADHPDFEVDYKTKDISGVNIEEDMAGAIVSEKMDKKSKSKAKIMQRKALNLGLIDGTHLTNRLTEKLDVVLSKSGYKVSVELAPSQDPRFGDFSSTVALKLVQDLKKTPQEIAADIAAKVKEDLEVMHILADVSVAPNDFINFRLSEFFLMSELERALSKKENFGGSSVGEKRVILVESPSINPNAAAHAGHLLNLFIGRALMRLFSKVGFDSQADNLINDRGIKICMAMWGVKNLSKGSPEKENLKSDHFVGKYYVQAKEKYANDIRVKSEIDQMLRDWETGKPELMELWGNVIKWAFEGHLATFTRLHEERGHLWLESKHYQGGKDVIMKNIGNGIIGKLPDGAVVARLEEKYGVADAVLLRSDGTSLYHTQDTALTLRKIEKFHPWRAIWVVGNEQIPHFQQNFALLDSLGILSLDCVYHFAYGIVVDKNGKRVGKGSENVDADDILDQMHASALSVMDSREIHVELDDRDAVAEAVGIGALRYAFLSHDPFRNVVYDPDSALSFTGRSGPYVMYAYSRGRSVLRKAFDGKSEDYKVSNLAERESSSVGLTDVDRELLRTLLVYPETILSAANSYAPNVLAEYMYRLASEFNNFYEKCPIAKAEGDLREFRLGLTKLATTVLKDGLAILGIDVLEKM